MQLCDSFMGKIRSDLWGKVWKMLPLELRNSDSLQKSIRLIPLELKNSDSLQKIIRLMPATAGYVKYFIIVFRL